MISQPLLFGRLVATFVLFATLCVVCQGHAAEPAAWPFFAFDNGVGRGSAITPDEQATILAERGYQGIGYTGVHSIPAMLKALDAQGLKMFSTYVKVDVTPGAAPYDPNLPEAIRQMKGAGTALWIHVHGRAATPAGLDDEAVAVIRDLADKAAASDLPVVLYPHTGFYVATLDDAVRLVKKIDRNNVGASFNLCHFLKQHDEKVMADKVKAAVPHLMLVSINGADSGDTRAMGWDRLIQTLDRGNYPVDALLQLLKDEGYTGPVGLQCYAIKGDIRDNLKRSADAWRKMTTGLK